MDKSTRNNCDHNFVSADNEAVSGCVICTLCHTIAAAIAPTYSLDAFVAHPVMILCPECGNKRCPKASDELLECTNSNEPGQVGSIYETK